MLSGPLPQKVFGHADLLHREWSIGIEVVSVYGFQSVLQTRASIGVTNQMSKPRVKSRTKKENCQIIFVLLIVSWSACLGQTFVAACCLSLAGAAAIAAAVVCGVAVVICGVTVADGIAAAVVCGVTAGVAIAVA